MAKTVAVTDPAPFINPNDSPENQEVTKKQSVAKGKALDIAEGSPLIGGDTVLLASRDYNILSGCDMVINTAGVPRKARPDGTFPSREELLAINLKVTGEVANATEPLRTFIDPEPLLALATSPRRQAWLQCPPAGEGDRLRHEQGGLLQ